MKDQYRLLGLGNSELLAGLSALVQQSNQLLGQLLAHLVELDDRKLHLELGYSSLFAYCVEALAMSEGAAGRRVTAARVCRRFPAAFEHVARGQLHLCALCALAQHLNPENAPELFEVCQGKTRRQVEELLAVRFPRPDVREQIRRLPVRAPEQRRDPSDELAAPIEPVSLTAAPIEPVSLAAAPIEPVSWVPPANGDSSSLSAAPEIPVVSQTQEPQPAATWIPAARRRGRQVEPLSTDRFGVHFTADAELRDLIERARALASHRLPNGDLASLMKLMAASFVRQEEKRRFGIGAAPRPSEASARRASSSAEQGAPPGEVPVRPVASLPTTRETEAVLKRKLGRYVPLSVRREIHRRDGGQCSFVSAAGRRCTARAFLELDHVEPHARLGASDARNLRLRCKAHNLLHARDCFGSIHIAAKLAARQRVFRQNGREGEASAHPVCNRRRQR